MTKLREPTDKAPKRCRWWNTSGVHSLIIPPFWNLRFLLFPKEEEGLKEKEEKRN
jgi:hypothetical protein